MFVLAHLSDPHLAPLPRPRLSELASKRLTGYLNWLRSRRAIHRADVLARIVGDLHVQAPDHVAVLGDLANISLPKEFETAAMWLRQLGSPQDVTLVPGNHDLYVRAASGEAERAWGDFMRGDNDGPVHFPFLRRRGPVSLVGLSTAVPTAPFMATGALGPAQLSELAQILSHLAREETFRVVLIHHPPRSRPENHRKRLIDGEAFCRVIAEHGADLVLHGHNHVHSLTWLDGPHTRIPALGVPSASASAAAGHDPAAYNLYRIGGKPGAWQCEAVSRGLRQGENEVVELSRRVLLPA
jgi:3',5'-cyclic AMP phosphodiesterase CpdA